MNLDFDVDIDGDGDLDLAAAALTFIPLWQRDDTVDDVPDLPRVNA